MELLKSSRWRKRPGLSFIALSCIAITGCVLVDSMFEKKAAPFGFSHRVHLSTKKATCADCHRTWESSDDPGMPSAAQCAICHHDLDAEKPPEKRADSLFVEGEYVSARTTALAEEIVFSHETHAARGGDCLGCHAGIDSNDAVSEQPAPTMDGCIACHAESKASNDCAVCHSQIRVELPPPNHDQNWKRVHGPTVRACTRLTVDRCELCHKESSCQSCHQNELPASHNPYWRSRGHGLVASMDRQSCATCHTPDSCDRCHMETKPLDHTAMWGEPLDQHCLACHEPLRSQSCFVCHKSATSHALATPLPPDHTAGMNCRMCHGNGQPLPHKDNGDSCTTCHM